MPDMRDYIAMYLASGQPGNFQAPPGGGPGMMVNQPPGGGGPPPMGVGGQPQGGMQMPGWPASPPGGYRGGRGLFEPGPGGPSPGPMPTIDLPGMTQTPPQSPYPFPSQGMPDDTSGLTPPVNTPMQAPPSPYPFPTQGMPDDSSGLRPPQMPTIMPTGGNDAMTGPFPGQPQVGGMDPQQWLRMYRGG